MNIIILGAGEVGSSLAENLAAETQDITLVDTNGERLAELQERFDLRTVQGICSHPSILTKAGGMAAHMLIAVTDNDESNLIACQVAHTLFQTPTKIARIQAQDYLAFKQLFGPDKLPVNVFFSPELLVTHQIQRLIEYPGTTQVFDFDNGEIKMITIQPKLDCILLNKPIGQWQTLLTADTANKYLCVALFRAGAWLTINHTTSLQIGDEVYVMTHAKHIPELIKIFGYYKKLNRNIMIAGGGNLGTCLAKLLENNYSLKIIEQNRERCGHLLQQLKNSVILCGNACDTKLLNNENIEDMDVFCALTNDDADNIIACLEAKQLGAKQVISLITRTAYIDLIESDAIKIDIAISPQRVTTDSILSHLKPNDLITLYSLRRNGAKIIEIDVQVDQTTSQLINRAVQQIRLKKDMILNAIIRDHQLLFPEPTMLIQAGDRLILSVMKKILFNDIEDLFEV